MGNADSRNARKVRRAIRQNDVVALRKLVNQKVDLDLAINQYSRNTPLILAACYASVDVIPLIIKASSNKNATNTEGHTALDKSIIFYSLANEYHPHKTKELLRRRRVVQLLIDGGVSKVREGELELWIRVNKSDPVFLHTVTHLFCRSNSTTLKSIGFAVMLRVNADLTCAACCLEAGASYHNYKMMYLSDLPSIDYKMPVNLAFLILQSTSDSLILQHIENIFLSAYPATKTKDEAREQVLIMLLQNDHIIRESHRKQYPEYDELMDHHQSTIKPLKWMCRTVVRRNAWPNVFFAVHRLSLPKKLENYLLLNDREDAEDPTLNAADNLNMGSNPPSAQVVRKRQRPMSRTEPDGRRRPLSHYHPADEIEKRRHRTSHSSAPSSPTTPISTGSPLAVVHHWAPRQRPVTQYFPFSDQSAFQYSPRRPRPVSQYAPVAQPWGQPSPQQRKNPNLNGIQKETIMQGQLKPVPQKRSSQNTPLPPIPTNQLSPKTPPQRIRPISQVAIQHYSTPIPLKIRPTSQIVSKNGKWDASHGDNRKGIEPPPLPQKSPKAYPSRIPQGVIPKESPNAQMKKVQPIPRPNAVKPKASARLATEKPQSSPKITINRPPEIQNIVIPQQNVPVVTHIVSCHPQPVLSTFAPQCPTSPSRRILNQRSPKDGKKPRPHSHFVPPSEVRNIFPPVSPDFRTRVYQDDHQRSAATEVRQALSGMPHNRSNLKHRSKSAEFGPRPMTYCAPDSSHSMFDTEFASHLEEALMKQRSQPPGQFLPTKEVLIDFGSISNTSEPYYSRSAGSTLNRPEVLLRPGSASLPRQDSYKRRSHNISPPSSPFNLVVNPRFIVAEQIKKDTPPKKSLTEAREPNSSDSEVYDEINDNSSLSSDEENLLLNEGYTRF